MDDVKWYVWSEMERVDRESFSESGISKFKISKGKQL